MGALLGLVASVPVRAQVCASNILPSTPAARFTDNGDGTVSDLRTKLMWKQCVEGTSGPGCVSGVATGFTWQGALTQVVALNGSGGFAGYTDWRLPNVKELSSIVETACYDPSINETLFPSTPSLGFWSSTPVPQQAYYAHVVYFYYGTEYQLNKTASYYVRLVRDLP